VANRAEWIELKIERDCHDLHDQHPPKLLYLSRVERRQLVRRWTDWLENDIVRPSAGAEYRFRPIAIECKSRRGSDPSVRIR
jgi:hypothetical protein